MTMIANNNTEFACTVENTTGKPAGAYIVLVEFEDECYAAVKGKAKDLRRILRDLVIEISKSNPIIACELTKEPLLLGLVSEEEEGGDEE
jgi:hypothetical protein